MKYSINKADFAQASDNKFKDEIHADEDACKNPGSFQYVIITILNVQKLN